MKKSVSSIFVVFTALALITACGESKVPKSPLGGGTKATGGGAGVNSAPLTVDGLSGGKLTVNNVTTSSNGTSIQASFRNFMGLTHTITIVNPGRGLLTISSQPILSDNPQDINNANNFSYYQLEGRCGTNSGAACDTAYYTIYTLDFDRNGTYNDVSNFGIIKKSDGKMIVTQIYKSDGPMSVDEFEQESNSANP